MQRADIRSVLRSLVDKSQPIIKNDNQKARLARVFKNYLHQGVQIDFKVIFVLQVIELRDKHFHVGVRFHTFTSITQNLPVIECSKQILESMCQEVGLIFNLLDGALLL